MGSGWFGVVVGKIAHATGNISITWPLSISGKSKCNQTTTFCDYFAGQIDYLQIQTTWRTWSMRTEPAPAGPASYRVWRQVCRCPGPHPEDYAQADREGRG